MPVAHEWHNIGALLGLTSELNIIEKDSHKTRDQLRMMLEDWLNMTDPPPSWDLLVEAVRKLNPKMAKEINDKYCLL